MKNNQVKILLVEDETIVRETISRVLRAENSLQIEIVGETGDGLEAVELAKKHKPHVVLMDILIRGVNGIDATRRILHDNPQIRVIVLSVHSSKTAVMEMLRAGAIGFLPKADSLEELMIAIRTVLDNRYYLSSEITPIVNEYFAKSTCENCDDDFLSLDQQEMTIVRLTAEGKSVKEIADFTGCTAANIAKRRQRITDRLRVRNMAELSSVAIRKGLVSRI